MHVLALKPIAASFYWNTLLSWVKGGMLRALQSYMWAYEAGRT